MSSRSMLGLAIATTTLALSNAAIIKDQVTSLPGLEGGSPATKQYSGYLDLPGSQMKHLHYWLVESEKDPETSPTVCPDMQFGQYCSVTYTDTDVFYTYLFSSHVFRDLLGSVMFFSSFLVILNKVFWFNGGPGCSSLDGYFYEHGPYHVVEPVVNTSSGIPTLYANPYAWNQIANIVFLEAPAGVGFSYADTQAGLAHNDSSTAEDNFAAVQLFYKGFPEYATNDLYIAGESYAGAYVPMLALQVLKHNDNAKLSGAAGIPLKGILVGNGVTGHDSIPSDVSNRLDVEFLFGHGLFSTLIHDKITKACGDYSNMSPACDSAIDEMHDAIGHINVYDIYSKCIMSMDDKGNEEKAMYRAPITNGVLARSKLGAGTSGPDGCIDAGAATLYLNHPAVQEAIHVTAAKKDWVICGGVQYTSTQGSLLPDYKATLIPNIRVLIFNGDVDCCVPYKGNEWWTSSLGLTVEKPWRPWTMDQQVAGYVTTYESNFNFVTVKGSGHMVPQFRPAQAFAMFQRMMENKPFDCESDPKGC